MNSKHDGQRPPPTDYNRFYNDVYIDPITIGGAMKTPPVSDCHPEFWDDPTEVGRETPYEGYESWPDNERWLGGKPPRQPTVRRP